MRGKKKIHTFKKKIYTPCVQYFKVVYDVIIGKLAITN